METELDDQRLMIPLELICGGASLGTLDALWVRRGAGAWEERHPLFRTSASQYDSEAIQWSEASVVTFQRADNPGPWDEPPLLSETDFDDFFEEFERRRETGEEAIFRLASSRPGCVLDAKIHRSNSDSGFRAEIQAIPESELRSHLAACEAMDLHEALAATAASGPKPLRM